MLIFIHSFRIILPQLSAQNEMTNVSIAYDSTQIDLKSEYLQLMSHLS